MSTCCRTRVTPAAAPKAVAVAAESVPCDAANVCGSCGGDDRAGDAAQLRALAASSRLRLLRAVALGDRDAMLALADDEEDALDDQMFLLAAVSLSRRRSVLVQNTFWYVYNNVPSEQRRLAAKDAPSPVVDDLVAVWLREAGVAEEAS